MLELYKIINLQSYKISKLSFYKIIIFILNKKKHKSTQNNILTHKRRGFILLYKLIYLFLSMSKSTKRVDAKHFSVSFPKSLVEEIDTICKGNYMTRSSWLVASAKEKIGADRIKKIEQLKELK